MQETTEMSPIVVVFLTIVFLLLFGGALSSILAWLFDFDKGIEEALKEDKLDS